MRSKLVFISFLATLVYFVASGLLFNAHSTDSTMLMFPAVLLFGAAYSGGNGALLMVGLIAFAIIWLILFLVISSVYKIIYFFTRK